MSLGLSLPLLLRLFGCLCLHYPISNQANESSASREIKNTPSKRKKNRAMQKEKNGAPEGKKN